MQPHYSAATPSARAVSYHADIERHAGKLAVHAVFSHSLHLITPDQAIVTVTDAHWNGPLTVRVGRGDLCIEIVAPRTAVRLTTHLLECHEFAIDLRDADVWEPQSAGHSINSTQLTRDASRVLAAVRAAHRGGLAGWKAPDTDSDELWLRHGRIMLRAFEGALRDCDNDGLRRTAVDLLGFGPGLTPSGDDLLCGVLAGLSIFGTRSPRHRARCLEIVTALTTAVLPRASGRTTYLSTTMLDYASGGIVSEPLLHVLDTLGSGTKIRGMHDVLMQGHSSGSDMLTGVLLACSALTRWEDVHGSTLDRSCERLSRLNQAHASLGGVDGV